MPTFKLNLKLTATAAIAAAAVLLSAVPAAAVADDDTPPSGYPSWQDVQNAKNDAASKSAEVDKITGLLKDLDAKTADLASKSVAANQSYAQAQQRVSQAQVKTDTLNQQVQQATSRADQLTKQAGALAVKIYQSGGASRLGVFDSLADIANPQQLQNAGIASVVTENMSNVAIQAKQAKNVTASLRDQQKQAQDVLDKLSQQSKDALSAAQSAQKSADDELAGQQKNSDTLKAQLASLNNTVAKTDDLYQQGVEAQKEYEAAQAAKAAAAQRAREQQAAAAAAAANNAGAPEQAPAQAPPAPSGGGAPVFLPPPPSGGAVNDPAGAQAYAASTLGAFGWGQDQMGCLINLWTRESDWRTDATNPTSGAYGIAQSLPPEKMYSAGNDWLTNYRTQINWGMNYIKGRYGSPCGAWGHETSIGWY